MVSLENSCHKNQNSIGTARLNLTFHEILVHLFRDVMHIEAKKNENNDFTCLRLLCETLMFTTLILGEALE